jgi:hypothetical protein
MLSVCFGCKTAAILLVVNAVGTGWEEIVKRELNSAKGIAGFGG